MQSSFTACVLVVAAVAAVEFLEEDGIVVLTNETFDNALQQFPQLFVEFCSYTTYSARARSYALQPKVKRNSVKQAGA